MYNISVGVKIENREKIYLVKSRTEGCMALLIKKSRVQHEKIGKR